MRACLIFGGNGFIGSHLAGGLLREGFTVKVFDTFEGGLNNLDSIRDNIELIRGDFLCDADVTHALQGIDYVFHYISTTNPVTSLEDPVFDIRSNIIGSVKLFQHAQNAGVKRVFFPSSGGTVYGEPKEIPITESAPLNPVNPYAISKLAIEKYLEYFHHHFGMEYTILRYSNPYGEHQSPYAKQGVIPIFLNKIKNNERPVIYGDGSTIRDFLYIGDAIDATIAVVKSGTQQRVFNIASGEETSLNQLIEIMSDVTNKKCVPEYINDGKTYLSRFVLDISRLTKETGWKPKIPLKEGIDRTWRWISSLES